MDLHFSLIRALAVFLNDLHVARYRTADNQEDGAATLNENLQNVQDWVNQWLATFNAKKLKQQLFLINMLTILIYCTHYVESIIRVV